MKYQNHIGLDIGEETIKLVQLSKDGNGFRLSAIGIAATKSGAPEPDPDKALALKIKKLVSETGASGKNVVLSLPESQVYTRVIELPYLEEPELSSTIRWQAEQYIPVALSEVVLKHQVLTLPETGTPDAKMTVLLVAAPNGLVSRYMALASKAGLEAVAIETEIFAVSRALVANDEFSQNSLVVNIGTETTTLAVLKKGDLTLTQSIPVAGKAITRAVATTLGIEETQAEEYKKTYGMNESQLEGKVAEVVKNVALQILTEVKKIIAYNETRPGGTPVKRVILCGGNSLIPGLLAYFTANVGLEVQLGNPFTKLSLSDRQKQAVFEAGPLFACSVGLALKQT